MNPIERRMWLTLQKDRLIPRFVKEAFAEEWANDRHWRALGVLACWQVPLTVFLCVAVNLLVQWLVEMAA